MAVLLTRECLVVTAAPGTGSTALRQWALARPGARQVPPDDVVDLAGRVVVDAKHGTATRLRLAGFDLSDVSVVTTTRDPFDWWAAEWHRCATRWFDDARDPTSWVHRVPGLVARIRRARRLPMARWVVGELAGPVRRGEVHHLNPGHVDEADVVLRMESLDDDLAELVPGARVARRNVSPRRPPDRWDEQARDRVATVHRPDLDRFGYRPPRLAPPVDT